MPGKILAFLLLLFGAGVTLYVLYKTALAILNPAAQKKPEQQFETNHLNRQHNNLQLYNNTDFESDSQGTKQIQEKKEP